MGLQATCTAARDGSLAGFWWTGYSDPGGAAGLVFCHALMILFFPGSVVDGQFAAALLAVGSALYAFRGGDFVSTPSVVWLFVWFVHV